MKEGFIQHDGMVVERGKFNHVMALSLDPTTNYHEGLVRCVVGRSGDITKLGNVDRSELHLVRGDSLEQFKILGKINVQDEIEIVKSLGSDLEFMGLEDPDIWIDPDDGKTHVYFTIPLRDNYKKYTHVHLGHAEGSGLDSLRMTGALLSPTPTNKRGAKELSIAPINRDGIRLNLIESQESIGDTYYSTIMVAKAPNPRSDWKYGDVVFHPIKSEYAWIGGHASPGPLLPRTFIDIGEDRLVGIINGRERDAADRVTRGIFSVGLMIYNYEEGKIEWVSERPIIQDTEARTITFASQFIETTQGQGILYAHVDDSFVRAYTLDSSAIKSFIP
ncbi:MAG TPA: hypothetical protein VG965_05100 [Patescibacteria group bacterium]|nr:hypothetical protein [Patescibacteria group bacterium]